MIFVSSSSSFFFLFFSSVAFSDKGKSRSSPESKKPKSELIDTVEEKKPKSELSDTVEEKKLKSELIDTVEEKKPKSKLIDTVEQIARKLEWLKNIGRTITTSSDKPVLKWRIVQNYYKLLNLLFTLFVDCWLSLSSEYFSSNYFAVLADQPDKIPFISECLYHNL